MGTHDYSDLPRVMREAQRTIPVQVDHIMTEVAETELSAIRSATPVGDGSSGPSGRLRGATRVQLMAAGKVRFVNPQVYANTIHWGRKVLNGTASVVAPTRFVYGTLEHDQPEINLRITQGLERALGRLG